MKEEEQKESEEFIKMARYNEWSGYTDPEDDGLSDSEEESKEGEEEDAESEESEEESV